MKSIVKFPYFVPALSLPSSCLPPIILLPEPSSTVHDNEADSPGRHDSAHPYDDSETAKTGREDGEICGGRRRISSIT